MKAADLRDGDNMPGRAGLDRPLPWAVVTETLVRPRGVVVTPKQATQVAFVREHR
jgi:hypothetical protein